MDHLTKAKQLLASEGCTCVLCRDDRVVISHRRGVAPLMELLDSGTDVRGFSAADKVIGRATALLYCLLGVSRVYGGIVSKSALEVLHRGGIEAEYDLLVPYIVNRAGDGRCPMETATAHITEPSEAPAAIRAKLRELQSK